MVDRGHSEGGAAQASSSSVSVSTHHCSTSSTDQPRSRVAMSKVWIEHTVAQRPARPRGEQSAPVRVTAGPPLLVRRGERGLVAPTLDGEPQAVPTPLEESPVEPDERSELPSRVTLRRVDLAGDLLDPGIQLTALDEGGREPRLGAVDRIDRGLGDAGIRRDRAHARAGPPRLDEALPGGPCDALLRLLGLLLAKGGVVGARGGLGALHGNHCTGRLSGSILTKYCSINHEPLTQRRAP